MSRCKCSGKKEEVIEFGDLSNWQLLCSREDGDTLCTTEALEVRGVGCLVRDRYIKGDSINQTLQWVPGVKVVMELGSEDYDLKGKALVALD